MRITTIISIYIFLLLLCGGLLIVSNFLNPVVSVTLLELAPVSLDTQLSEGTEEGRA